MGRYVGYGVGFLVGLGVGRRVGAGVYALVYTDNIDEASHVAPTGGPTGAPVTDTPNTADKPAQAFTTITSVTTAELPAPRRLGCTDDAMLLPTAPIIDVIWMGVLPMSVTVYVSCSETELHVLAGTTDSKSEQAVVVPLTSHLVTVTCETKN